MALKTNYKDDGFVGNRKYRQITNPDNTVSFEDVTAYSPVGDNFGAKDINDTNTEVNKLEAVKAATLTAAGWSTAAPFTQTVTVAGITAADNPIVSLRITEGSAAIVKAQNKAYGCVDQAVTGAGNIMFYCYNKRPAANFTVAIKGV